METILKLRSALAVLALVTAWVIVVNSGCGQVQGLDVKTAFAENAGAKEPAVKVGGVFPKLTVMAKGLGSDSEAGIGALIPWAEKLWAIGYVSHIRGKGLGLYEISDDMTMRRHLASVTGTFANRMAHWPSGQAFIGPHAIDAEGNVRTIESLRNYRLTATVQHLTDPKNKVYFLGMEGHFWEVDVHSLEVKLLFNLVKELEIKNAKHISNPPTPRRAGSLWPTIPMTRRSFSAKEMPGGWPNGTAGNGRLSSAILSWKSTAAPPAALTAAIRFTLPAGQNPLSCFACSSKVNGCVICCPRPATRGTTPGTPNGCESVMRRPNAC